MNAGHTPPLLLPRQRHVERLSGRRHRARHVRQSRFETGARLLSRTTCSPSTATASPKRRIPKGVPFDEQGLETVLSAEAPE